MSWHRKNSLNAGYTNADTARSRPVCASCAYGSMHQTSTNHRRQHPAVNIRRQPTYPANSYVWMHTPTLTSHVLELNIAMLLLI